MTVYTMLADGFEEVEALAVIDVLKRADYEVKTVSIQDKEVVAGAHNIGIVADLTWRRTDFDQCDMIFLPGGMPGSRYLADHKALGALLKDYAEHGRKVAAICAAPGVLGGLGILKGKKAVCYPGVEDKLIGAEVLFEEVVQDGCVTTSRGMGTAIPFALHLVSQLVSPEKAEELKKSIIYQQ